MNEFWDRDGGMTIVTSAIVICFAMALGAGLYGCQIESDINRKILDSPCASCLRYSSDSNERACVPVCEEEAMNKKYENDCSRQSAQDQEE